jgi:hypothetical protein
MRVLYQPAANNTASDMIARQMQSTGTRQLGRLPVMPRVQRPGFSMVPGLSGYIPNVPYQQAKRMKLGALGLTSQEVVAGGKAGIAASGAATGIASGIASAVGAGAAAGSVVPVIGTAIGAIVGLLASGILNRQDQEVGNFDQAVAIWQQNRLNVLNIANKYLVLAGLFDLSLNSPHIPIYLQYGRMGEQRFVTDLVNVIYHAATTGQITASDTPDSIFNRIVQPWINSFGKGTMQDPHGDMINLIIEGMIADYVVGQQGRWLARGGDFPFAGLPPFPLQQIIAASQPPAVVGPAPVPVTVQPTPVIPAANVPAPVLPTPVALPVPPVLAPPVVPPVNAAPTPPAATINQPVAPQVTLPAPLPVTSPSFPTGFTLVGQDANNNPVYANQQGVLYQWNGSSMVAFSGSLSGQSSSVAAQIQAAIQTALAQGQSQAQATANAMQAAQSAGVQVTPQLQQQVQDQTAVTATAPPQVTAAGIGGMFSGTTGLLVVGGVLALLFATARPAPHG